VWQGYVYSPKLVRDLERLSIKHSGFFLAEV